jgi:hypothetical protein
VGGGTMSTETKPHNHLTPFCAFEVTQRLGQFFPLGAMSEFILVCLLAMVKIRSLC